MIPPQRLLELIMKNTCVLPAMKVPLGDVVSRVLAKDMDLPLFDNSAMNGYAVRAEGLSNASHKNSAILPFGEELRAGLMDHRSLKQGASHPRNTRFATDWGAARVQGANFEPSTFRKKVLTPTSGLNKFALVVMDTHNDGNRLRLCDAPSVVGLGWSLGSGDLVNRIKGLRGQVREVAVAVPRSGNRAHGQTQGHPGKADR